MIHLHRRLYPSLGLTLIEILVSLAIIGVLVAVVTASFSDSRAQARDKVRMTSLKELQLAIEQYKAQNGNYPEAGCGAAAGVWVGPGSQEGSNVDCDNYVLGLVPDYIPKLPTDPNQEEDFNEGFMYITDASRSVYKLMVHGSIESIFVNGYDNKFARCSADCDVPHCDAVPQNYVYAVYSSNTVSCW